LVPLLVLTTADYALWDWSIADGHDIVSLVAGLTLLPLAAVSLGGLVLAGARLLGLLFGTSSSRVRTRARERARTHTTEASTADPHTPVAEPDSSSSRLAA
jgi:hypothetical protein